MRVAPLIGALVLVLAAFILLTRPVAYHRIVDRGENWPDLHSFVLSIMRPTLPLFALSMGLTLYIATEKVDGVALAVICSVTGAGLALMLWYAVGSGRKKSRRRGKPMKDTQARKTKRQKQSDQLCGAGCYQRRNLARGFVWALVRLHALSKIPIVK